jgi:hypothetical protein
MMQRVEVDLRVFKEPKFLMLMCRLEAGAPFGFYLKAGWRARIRREGKGEIGD